MADPLPFDELVRRLRAGDEAAATELVRQFEPAVRRVIRFRLNSPALRPAVDTSDVCQSVLLSFFLRFAAGEYDLTTPERLVGLLTTMARNKTASQARRHTAGRRDRRRSAGVTPDEAGAADAAACPVRRVVASELLAEAKARLTPAEWQLVEWRTAGREWAEIAAELGETAVAVRQRLSRALGRVERDLGLDDSDE